jgi:hypothetical protein
LAIDENIFIDFFWGLQYLIDSGGVSSITAISALPLFSANAINGAGAPYIFVIGRYDVK